MALTYADVRAMTADEQSTFITRTYMHLVGAIAAFVLLESWLFSSGTAERILGAMAGVSWLVILGGFVIVSWIASRVAHTVASPALQYAALGGFIVAEAIIFVPLIAYAESRVPGTVTSAAATTIVGFVVLSAIVFRTRRNFSFLRPLLMWIGFGALGLIVASVLLGFQLGQVFSIAMVVYAGGAVLYDTSRVLHDYRPGQHVGAALELFASIALMFWYVLRLFSEER